LDLIFLHGDCRAGLPLAGWLGDARRWPGTLRGRLWRAPAGGALLVLDDAAPLDIIGEIARPATGTALAALDAVLASACPGTARVSVEVVFQGRSGTAFAWATPAAEARRRGAQRLDTADWAQLASRSPRRGPR
jgi:hypothetical protein